MSIQVDTVRVLFCPMAEGVGLGPLSQLLGVAEELTLRGGRCAFLINENHVPIVRRLGHKYYVAPKPQRKDLNAPDFRMSDAARALGVVDPEYLDLAIGSELSAIDEFKPTVLMSATKLTVPASSRIRGLPLVSIAATPDGPEFQSPLYDAAGLPDTRPEEVTRVMARHGVEVRSDIAELSYMHSSYAVSAAYQTFDPFLKHDELSYYGPLTCKGIDLYTPLPELDGRPLVTVYINRGSADVGTYLQALSVVAADMPDYHFVVVEKAPPTGFTAPANMLVLPEAPIGRLLSESYALISGGGQNAIMLALLAGVPVLGVRGRSAERDFNLRRVEALGAGLVVEPPIESNSLRDALSKLFKDANYQHAAAEASAALRQLSGAAGVANLLLEIGR